MAGRLSSSTIMEDREARRREAARERQERGANSGITAGLGPQFRPARIVAYPNAVTPQQGLFAGPVRVEQEDETSRMIKQFMGNFQDYSRPVQSSTFPTSGLNAQVSSAPLNHNPNAQVASRRSQQQTAPPPPRQSNGVPSTAGSQQSVPHKPKEQVPVHTPATNSNYSKPLVTAASRKSHTAEHAVSHPKAVAEPKKSGSTPNLQTTKSSNHNNNNSNSTNNNSSRPADLGVRLEEVLKEMKVPPILPHIDDLDRIRETKKRDEREAVDKSRTNPPIAPSHQTAPMKVISSPQVAELAASGEMMSSITLGGIPPLPIEPPPTALSPMRNSPLSLSHNQNDRPTAQSLTAPANNIRKPVPEILITPKVSKNTDGLSSASSSDDDDDDDDDHESASQEDSQDSDVENKKNMRMETNFDKSFASTEKNYPERNNPFGETNTVSSLFPQRVPQLQVPRPNSADGRSIGSPLSDDTNDKGGWGLATFISNATPNSVSSVKSPMKTPPPRFSPELAKTTSRADSRQEKKHRKRKPETPVDSEKEPLSAEKRKFNSTRTTRSSLTPDPESPLVRGTKKVETSNRSIVESRVSPLIQNHDSNGSAAAEGRIRSEDGKRKRDDKSRIPDELTVKIPLARLKRKPQPMKKCDTVTTLSHKDERINERLVPDRHETRTHESTVNHSNANSTIKDTKDSNSSNPIRNNGSAEDPRRADSPMSIDSLSSESSRRRLHSPDVDDLRRRRKDEERRKRDKPKGIEKLDKDSTSAVTLQKSQERTQRDSRKTEDRRKTNDTKDQQEQSKRLKEDVAKRSEDRKGTITDRTTESVVKQSNKDEKRDLVDSAVRSKDDKRRTESSRDMKYSSKDRFQRGVMLSDAAERHEKDAKVMIADRFISEARRLKHDGDDRDKTMSYQVRKYLESALSYMLGGYIMETSNRVESISQVIKMYQDTQTLVKHIYTQKLMKEPQGATHERLTVLALRVQAALSHRVFLAINRDKEFRDKSSTALHEFLNMDINKLIGNDHGSTNGSTVSPAGSHSSASSFLLGSDGRDNGSRQETSSQSGGRPMVTVPVNVLEMAQKLLQRYIQFHRAYELWNQSCNVMNESNNRDFFEAVAQATAGSGHNIDFTIPTGEFVKYVREAIFRIEKYANVP